ncbi:MAG: hypothetical protein R3357_05335 [Burkholderiales bacterium]|nr:hypothetical protein [Burkholderiales bacterium]
MSDIGFHGIVGALVGVAMMAIALIGLIVEGILLWNRRRAQRAGRGFVVGPLGYAIVATVVLAVVGNGSLEAREWLDDWSWSVALAAVIPWIALHWSRTNQGEGVRP